MEKDSSPLDTLRQLKEWLDAGTITPQEFETLKRKLLFNESTGATPPAAANAGPTIGGPVEEPLLPPVVPTTPTESLPPSAPAEPMAPFSRPIEGGRPGGSPESVEPGYYTAPAAETEPEDAVTDLPPAPAKNPLNTVLIVGGIVVLLALMAYLLLGNRESERLTSLSRTAADSVAVTPEEGPQAERIELPPAAVPETVRVAPAMPVAPPDTTSPGTAPPTTEQPPATPDLGEVRTQIADALNDYYQDLKAAPFNAKAHFAPQVERFYTMSNATPAAINDDLAKSHFPEFTEEETQVEPGSLQVKPGPEAGTWEATYLEKSRVFRQSRQQHQQTSAQMRVRFNSNLKITYLRQEKLLENTFSE